MTAEASIVLVGAARSGTKILRDALGHATGAGVVPYDVGYVWRYGNESAEDDVLDPARALPRTRKLVRGFLDRYRVAGVVIEKSVGNALRVPFVHAVLPEARFVHLVRDGIDVTESAMRQWQAPTDWRYVRRKAAHFPLRLVPTYGRKFLANATWRRRSLAGHSPTWGPRYPGIDADVQGQSLLVTCARQWRECVVRARDGLGAVPAQTIEVRYEELVADPRAVITWLVGELGLPAREDRIVEAAALVRAPQGPAARDRLDADQLAVLDHEIGPLLEELGYARPR